MHGLRISELADRVGLPTSTVRYYERVGLLPIPDRTSSGYRSYDDRAEARLVFVARAKRLGLSLDEIAELVDVWDGTNCGATQERLASLLAVKQVDIAVRIRELEQFAEQLSDVQRRLDAAPRTDGCSADLNCCAPELSPASISMGRRRPDERAPLLVADRASGS